MGNVPNIGLRDEDMDINTMITTHNTAVTGEILGKKYRRINVWVTIDVQTCVIRGENYRRSCMKQKEQ